MKTACAEWKAVKEKPATYDDVIFDGFHDIGNDFLGLLDCETPVVQAEEVVLVASVHHEQRLVESGQLRQALHESSCKRHITCKTFASRTRR